MFNFVHHVRILVHDADQMVEYMDRNFGMTPVKVEVFESRGMKNAIYKVGSTNLEFTEPLDANSKMAKFLAEEGPGVYHIAFGVDDVRGAAKELLGKGNKRGGEEGITRSPKGYSTETSDAESPLVSLFSWRKGRSRGGDARLNRRFSAGII